MSATSLQPIEPFIRDEPPPDDAVLVIRGGPLTADKLMDHAARQALEYSYRGTPMFSVSVDATIGNWTLEQILRRRMWSRSTYATTSPRTLRIAGYLLLPTFAVPHCDIVLPAATMAAAADLLAQFGAALDNPFKRRR